MYIQGRSQDNFEGGSDLKWPECLKGRPAMGASPRPCLNENDAYTKINVPLGSNIKGCLCI